MTIDVVFRQIDENTPGFLLRAKQALEFKRKIETQELAPELIDDIVRFMKPYIAQPEDDAEKVDALYNLSKVQYLQLLKAVTEGLTSASPLSAKETSEQSSSSPAESE